MLIMQYAGLKGRGYGQRFDHTTAARCTMISRQLITHPKHTIMKTTLLILAAVCLTSCFTNREIQAEMVSVQLVRIDTVFHYGERKQVQQLTWKDKQQIEYVTTESMDYAFVPGTHLLVLRKK